MRTGVGDGVELAAVLDDVHRRLRHTSCVAGGSCIGWCHEHPRGHNCARASDTIAGRPADLLGTYEAAHARSPFPTGLPVAMRALGEARVARGVLTQENHSRINAGSAASSTRVMRHGDDAEQVTVSSRALGAPQV